MYVTYEKFAVDNYMKCSYTTHSSGVWSIPANFNGFPYCTDVAQWWSTKLCTIFGRLCAGIYTFFGALAP